MPPTLPSEFLLAIFEFALPSAETVSEYNEREKTLTSLCLVSRQFCEIAQPLIWRIFRPRRTTFASPRLLLASPQISTGQTSLVEPIGLNNQLDMMQVGIWTSRSSSSDLPDRDVPVLLAFALNWTEYLLTAHVARFRHFQLDAWETRAMSGRKPISKPPSRLSAGSVEPSPNMRTCRLDSKKPVDDEAVSKEFWACAKELKREEALEAEGGAGGSGSV
ncbi:hypothetical protein JCM8547_002722 [Rhodosporidiobolus lusitaniae]